MDKIIRQGIQIMAGLDKASEKELRSTLSTIFSEAGNKIDFNTSENRKNIESLAKAFKAIFDEAGDGSINFEELIKMPSSDMFTKLGEIAAKQFWDAWNAVASGAANSPKMNIDTGANKEFENFQQLMSKRQALMEKQAELEDQIRKKQAAEHRVGDAETTEQIAIDGNFDKNVKEIYNRFNDVHMKLQSMNDEGKLTETIVKEWTAAAKELNKVYNTLYDNSGSQSPHAYAKTLIDPEIADYLFNEEHGLSMRDEDFEFGEEILMDFFDVDEIADQREDVIKEIKKINSDIEKITIEHPEFVSKQETAEAEERLRRIQQAYDKIVKQSEGARKRSISSIQAALSYEGKGKNLTKLTDDMPESKRTAIINKELATSQRLEEYYGKSQDTDSGWVEQSKNLIRFIREYESVLNNPNADQNLLAPFKEAYQELKPMVAEAENMLQNVLNMTNKTPLVDMKDGESAGETERKAQAEKEAAEAAAKAKVDAEAKAQADAEAAAAAERERLAREEAAKAEKARLDALVQSLSKLQQSTKGLNYETMSLIGADGVIDTVRGQEDIVDTNTLIHQLMSNFKESFLISLHNHPDGQDLFTPDDLKSFANLYYNQGSKINGIIAGNIIKTIDFSNISQEVAANIQKSFVDNLKQENDVDPEERYFTYDEKSGLHIEDAVLDYQKTNPKMFEAAMTMIRIRIEQALNDAFTQNGLEPTVRTFTESQLPELAQYLLDIQQNGQNALAPIEKLKTLLMTLQPNHKFDWGNYADVLSRFEEGSLDGEGAVSEILSRIKSETQAHQENAKAKIDEVEAQEKLNAVEREPSQVDDDTEIINKENGALEDKLELLRDIAEEYGRDITQKDRNRYEKLNQKDMDEGLTEKEEEKYWELGEQIDDADAALLDFEETYDRIILKLANGKEVEILPDDKGLRTLAEIADGYGDEYKGIEIEDVVFERVKKGAIEADVAVDDLNDSLEQTSKLGSGDKTGSGTGDVSSDELERLRVEAEEESRRAREAEEELARIKAESDGKKLVDKDVPDDDSELRRLRAEVEDERNKREYAESSERAASARQWEAEEEARKAEEEAERLRQQLAKVQTIPKGTGTGDVGHTPDVNAKAFTEESKAAQDAIDKENQALQTLRASLQLTTKKINTKTDAFTAEGKEVSRVVQKEINALKQLNTQVGIVNKAVLDLLKNLQNTQTAAPNIPTSQHPAPQNNSGQGSGGSRTSPQLLNAKIDTQFSSLSLMYARLQSVGKLTPEIEQQWLQLWDSLSKVNDTTSLQLWREELAQTKNSMEEIMIANNLVEQEGEQSFQSLINITKLYNKMAIGAARAKTPEEKAFYEQEANSALIEQQRILQSITLTKKQQSKFDELEIERSRQINLIQAKQIGREKQIHDAQVEADIIQNLVELYKQLGKAQFLGNTQEASNIRGLIGAERAKLPSIDHKTDMKFKRAKNRAYNAEKAKSENETLKEQKQILSELNTLYKEYGILVERAGATKGTNFGTQVADEVADKEAEIKRLEGKLSGGVTPEIKKDFDEAFDRGKAIESIKQYEAMSKKADQDEATRLNNIKKLEVEMGRLRAQADNEPNAEVKEALEEEIHLREILIGLQKKGLSMDAQDEAYYRQLYADRTKQARADARKPQNKDTNKDFEKDIKKAQKTVGINTADSAITAGRNTVINTIGNIGLTDDVKARAKELADEIEALDKLKAEVQKAIATGQDVDQTELNQSIKKVRELKAELDQLNKIHDKYQDAEGEDVDVASFKNLDPEQRAKQMLTLAQAMTNGRLREAEYNAETGELTAKVKEGTNTFKTYSFAIDEVDGQFKKLNTGTKKTETFIEGISRKMREAAQYVMGSLSIYDVWNKIKQGFQHVREIDTALTELKKVTDETEESYERFLDTASKTADKVGSTIKDVVNSTADWARLGYSIEEAHKLAESTSVLLNVSEFGSIDEATSALISSMQAFGYTADESMNVVDVMNTIGNNFAVSTDGLATALQDSASALMSAGNDYQQAAAMVAAANKVVQDPSKVGGGLRTIALRLRGTKADGEEDNDTVITSKSKLQSKIKGLSGVDILTDTGAYKSTYQILLEISRVWKDMNDMDQAALLEIIAGKNRSNIAASILNNTKDLEEAYASAMDADGSALIENEKYLDSIEGKIKQLTNAYQTLWKNTLNDEWVKGFVDAGTVIVELIDKLGLLQTVLLGIFAIGALKTKQSTNELLGELWQGAKTRAKAVTYGKDSIKKDEDTSKEETDTETEAIKRNTAAKQENAEATANASAAEDKNTVDKLENASATDAETSNTKENTGAKIENANANHVSGAAEDKDTQDTVENIGATKTDTNTTKENTAANIENAKSSQVAAQGEQTDTSATNANIGATKNDSDTTKANATTNASSQAGNVVSGVAGAVGTAKTASNVAKTTKAMSGLSKGIGLVVTAGKGLLKVIGGFLKSNWIILVITLLPKVYSWLTNLKSAEEKLAEQTAALEEEWSNLYSTISGHAKEFNSLKKSTEELIPKYAELAQGVDKFGENVFLTDDEYKEFLSLNNQLAEMFPELVVGYDENGNAMLNLAGDVDALTESIKSLVEAKRLEAAEDIADTMPDVMDNIAKTSKLYEDARKKQEEYLQKANDAIRAIQESPNNVMPGNTRAIRALFGADSDWRKATENYLDEFGNIDWQEFIKSKELQNVLSGVEKQINDYSNRIETTWGRLNQVVSQWALTDIEFSGLEQEGQQVVQKLIGSIDFSKIEGLDDSEDVQDYIKDNIITPFADAEPEVQEAIGSLFDLKGMYESGELNTQQYQTVLNEMIAQLKAAGIGDETIEAIKVSLDVEDVETKIAELRKYFTAEEIGSLTSEELEFAYRIVQKEGSMSFEDLEKKIEQMAFNEADMVSVWDFSDMIKDLDKAKEGMDDLIDAMGKLSEGTALTKGELAQLAFKYPELLEASNLFTDGSVQGQKNMLNSILDMTEQEYDAQIDAKIAELEATNQVLQQQLDVEAEKANMLLQIEEGVANGKISSQAQLEEAIAAYYNREGQNFVSLKNGELQVNKKSLDKQLEVGVEFGEESAENVWNPYADLIEDASEKGYSGAADATNSFGHFLSSAAQNMGKTMKGLWGYIKDVLDPTKSPGDFSSYFTEAYYKNVTERIPEITFKGTSSTVGDKTIDEWVDIQTEYNKEFQVQLNDTIKKNLNVINNLENLKGLDLDEIYAKDGKDNKGDDNTKDQETDYERFQRLYERKLANLEGQQTYIQNEIDTLEALNKGVSTDYYKELIDKENQKLTLHTAQRDVLKALFEAQKANIGASEERMKALSAKTSLTEDEEKELEVIKKQVEEYDKLGDSLWKVEHSIQESTKAAIEFGKIMHNAQIEAIGKISEAYDAMDTISGNRKENLELYKENLEINGEYASEGWYNEMIRLTEEDATRKKQEVDDLLWAIDEYRNMENPFEKDTDEYNAFEEWRNENTVKLQADAATAKNEWKTSINEADQLREDMKDSFIEAWDNISEAFDSIGSFLQNQLDFIDAYEERLNTLNINIPDEVYEAKIDTQKDIISNLDESLDEDYRLLDEYESKYGKDDKRYVEKLEQATKKELQKYQEETKILEFEQQIFDNQIDRFNQVIDRINDATQRLQNISDLIGDEDVATEDGEWTDEGLTRLGMAYQQMAYNKQAAEEYAEKMEDVENAYRRGEISEKKYYETMKELSDGQWDAINGYEEMKDAIVEINEARIDMIEEGLNKEAEAYQELIELKKEELSAEKDLYDFKKNIEKQTKDIAALERRIASMGGSTDASTIAERTKLEAELRNAKDELDGSYRDHAYDSMSNALDDELDAYTKNSEDYIKSLRESIKETDLLVEQTYQKVLQNTDVILQEIVTMSDKYGFYIDEDLTAPWENAQKGALDLETSATSHIDAIYNKVDSVTSTLTANVTQPWKDGKRDLLSFSGEVEPKLQKMLEDAQTKQGAMSNALTQPWKDAKGAIDMMPTYADAAAKGMLKVAKQNVIDINAEYAKIKYPDYGTEDVSPPKTNVNKSDSNNTSNNNNSKNNSPSAPKPIGNTTKTGPAVTALQEVLNLAFGENLSVDGSYGPATKAAVEDAQRAMKAAKIYGGSIDGLYGTTTKNSMATFISQEIQNMRMNGNGSSMIGQGIQQYQNALKKIPAAIYAKGTMSTTRDQFAITDESWIGEEITLAAGKNGQLQYLKKGSAVMPADISANLVEWGKLNPNMMGIGSVADGINLMSNYINKPEIKLDIENFLNVGTVSRDTLPELEKLMDKKIDTFAKQLNASIRKFK